MVILAILGVVALSGMLALGYWLRRRNRKALFVSNAQIRQRAGTHLFHSKKRY